MSTCFFLTCKNPVLSPLSCSNLTSPPDLNITVSQPWYYYWNFGPDNCLLGGKGVYLHSKIFSKISGLFPLDSSSIPSPFSYPSGMTAKIPPEISKYPQVCKMAPGWAPLTTKHSQPSFSLYNFRGLNLHCQWRPLPIIHFPSFPILLFPHAKDEKK